MASIQQIRQVLHSKNPDEEYIKIKERQINMIRDENEKLRKLILVEKEKNRLLVKEELIFQILSGKQIINVEKLYDYCESIYDDNNNEIQAFDIVRDFVSIIIDEVYQEDLYNKGNVYDYDQFYENYEVKVIVSPKN